MHVHQYHIIEVCCYVDISILHPQLFNIPFLKMLEIMTVLNLYIARVVGINGLYTFVVLFKSIPNNIPPRKCAQIRTIEKDI